jgi:hypothetical protein
MTHTTGPWTFEQSHGKSVHGSECVGFVVSDKTNVADVVASYNIPPDEAEANGRLIAASPRMYDYIKTQADKGDADAAAIIASI